MNKNKLRQTIERDFNKEENYQNIKNKINDNPNKNNWKLISFGLITSFIAVIIIGTLFFNNQTLKSEDSNPKTKEPEHILVEDYLTIYYLEENSIQSKQIFIPYTKEKIFQKWLELNKINDRISISYYNYNSNGQTTGTSHTIGNYFTLNITLSKEFSQYANNNLLIESLKKTFDEFNRFDEFNLKIEN